MGPPPADLRCQRLHALRRIPPSIGLSAPAPGVLEKKSSRSKTVAELLAQADHELAALYEKFETFALSLGDDVVKNERSLYFTFRQLKNFACVEVHPPQKTCSRIKARPGVRVIQRGI